MRKIFFVMLACVAFCTVQAQRFEWVKGYDSGYDDAYIKGSVTDSHGNLYILGQFHYDSDWEGGVNPLCGQITTQNTMVIVAKISPEGEMVWKKMFGNTSSDYEAQDIKSLGDTGFAVLFRDSRCFIEQRDYMYWVDTVYRTTHHPLLDSLPSTAYGYYLSGMFNTFLAFDYDGNITEHHIISTGFVDTEGNNYMALYPDSTLLLGFLDKATFDVDAEGNIYICRRPTDYHFASGTYNGNLAKVQYWVDHRIVGESLVGDSWMDWYPHLLKFSPHFDTLLASRYVVQESDTAADARNGINPFLYTKLDKSTSNLYVRTFIQYTPHVEEDIVIDSTTNMIVHLPLNGYSRSFVTVHDSNLEPHHIIELQDSVLNSNGYYSNTWLIDIDFEVDSNLVAISGAPGLLNAVYTYNGTQLPLSDKAFVILLDKSDYNLHAVIQFPSMGSSLVSANKGHGNLALKNNRVFLQANYKQGVRFPSGFSYVTGGSDKTGLALAIFDYQGNLIDGIDYKTYSKRHKPGPIALVDSNLYLIDLLAANATLGEHTVYVYSDCYFSSIAKYVDTSFMSVYRRPSPEAVDVAEQGKVSCYPNPARDVLSLDLGNEMLLHATAVSILGQATTVAVGIDWVDISPLPAGTYLLEVETARHNKYKTVFVKQ